jgi:hypothetical protein
LLVQHTMRKSSAFIPAFAACMVFFLTSANAQQPAPTGVAPAPACSLENALDNIRRQIDLSKTIDDDAKRIGVMLRAADLTWPYEQSQARTTFTDAFDLATRFFKEKGEKDTNQGRLIVGGVDYRYRVITAIAKRDPIWGRKLSKQILDEEAQEAADKTKDSSDGEQTASKLLNTATSLAGTDPTTALAFARSSLAYPGSVYLPFFLFKLAETDRRLSDQFYLEAITAYAHAPMDQFLYLSSYPLAAHREIGEMPIRAYYTVPAALTPNMLLERTFVLTLLGRARELIQNPAAAAPGRQFSDASQIFMGLSRLEPLIAMSLPDFSGALAEAKGNIYSLLNQPEQQRTGEKLTDPPKKSFDETIEEADKLADADIREGQIALAVLNAAETGSESLEKLEAASLKLDDVKIRSQVMSLMYFYRSQKLLKEKKIGESRRLAAKVEEPDQRAYLYAQIATESLKQTKNDTEVREMLEDVLQAVAKAPNSEVKARAMLVVVHLYITIDPNRAVALLGEVVKTINSLESIDLSGDHIQKRIEAKGFGTYRGLQTPGFSPEIVFREMGKLDFDGTLYVASNLNDKSLRALTSLSLADQCIKDLPPPPKPKPNKPAAPKP